MRANGRPWRTWVAAWIVVLAVPVAPLAGGAAHCGPHPEAAAPAPHRHHAQVPSAHHGAIPEDSQGDAGCPHCPPVQCGAQAACPLNALECTPAAERGGSAGSSRIQPRQDPLTPASRVTVPPTPPPQLRS